MYIPSEVIAFILGFISCIALAIALDKVKNGR